MVYWIVLWGLIGIWFVVTLVVFCSPDFEWGGNLGISLLSGLACAFIFGMYCMIASSTTGVATTKLSSTTELVSLGNTSEIEGKFFLGTGSIGEKQVFKFMSKDSDGGVSVDTKYANNSKVYEIVDGSKPRMETHLLYRGASKFWPFESSYGYGASYKFYVPDGSVVESFELSLN